MALPIKPNNPNIPIPNNPFYSDETTYFDGPYYPAIVNLTSGITVGPDGVITVTGGGGGGGGVTAVTGTSPIVSSGGTTPDISISASTPTTIGAIAGYTDITDTDFNTALGYCALNAAAAAGFANVAVGICAGCSVTTAYGNTLIGPGTGIAIDTGNTNTALGIGALQLTTSGFANLAAGMCSGCAYTTESGNAVFGGHPGTAGDTNVLILADGAGNLKAKFDADGALSFDGTAYGTAGQVLSSNGPGAKPTWIAAGGGGVTSVTGTAPIVSSGGTTPAISVNSATPLTRGVLIGCSGGSNTSVGENALRAITAGQSNTALGFDALCSVTSSVSNTAVGDSAASKVTGTQNAAVGGGALFNNATGNCNTAMGNFAMMFSSGSCNSALGHNSLRSTSGINNVGVGINAGSSLTSGDGNVVIGPSAQALSATGSCQLAIGFSASDNWLTGDSTKAIRPGAGIIDCAGSCGTAGQVLSSNGGNAIEWVTGGGGGASPATPTVAGIVLGCTLSTVTAIGSGALGVNTGALNTAFGVNALCSNTTGARNVALGFSALLTNVSGGNNVAIGVSALNQSTGGSNTAIGSCSLITNTAGNHNTAVGFRTLFCSTSTGFSVALGSCALHNNTTGCFNTAIGAQAMCANTTGNGNVVVGSLNSAGTYSPVFNVLGVDNRVVMGSSAVTDAYVQVAWTVVSDARDKIVEGTVPHGLSFVKNLEPKAFYFKETRDSDTPHGRLRYGFLAQEVLALEGETGVIIDNEDPEKLRYNGEALVPVLVNAIKELSAKVEALEAKLASNG